MGKGKILYKYGAMNSGKSLQLLATAFNFRENAIPFLMIKSSIDTRDGENVIHSRALGDMECVSIDKNEDVYKLISDVISYTDAVMTKKPKWILVDEAQFLTEKQVDQLAYVADNYGINIICYGLRTDFKSQLFPGSKRLFELADSFEEIKSSCSCGNKATMNARVDNKGNMIKSGSQIEVGGEDKYVTLCRKCFFEKFNNNLKEE